MIDENTQIQPLPKKNELIKKPDIKDYKERETKNRTKIDAIIEKKVRSLPPRRPSAKKNSSFAAPKYQ